MLETCTTTINDAKCFVIDGKMKVFADNEWDDDNILSETCKILNTDTSLKRHIAVQSLKCISNNLDLNKGNEPDPVEESEIEFEPVSNSLSAVTVTGALAAIMVVFGVVFYRRRQKKQTTAPTDSRTTRNNLDHLDDSDINASTSISFEEAIIPGPPAMNFNSILHESVKNSANGIGTLARNSYFPVS